jgi:hypothetical protein
MEKDYLTLKRAPASPGYAATRGGRHSSIPQELAAGVIGNSRLERTFLSYAKRFLVLSHACPSTKEPPLGSVVRLTSDPELAASRSWPGRKAATARLKSAIGSAAFSDDPSSCVFANWLHRRPKFRTVLLTFLRLFPQRDMIEVLKSVSLIRQTFPPFDPAETGLRPCIPRTARDVPRNS